MIRSILCLLMLLCLLFPVTVVAQDPGLPDTVMIGIDTLVVGRSVPLSFRIVNDETVLGYTLGLLFTSLDGGYAEFDSAVYMGRLADPSVLTFRVENYYEGGPLHDTLFMGGQRLGVNPGMPPGNGQIAELYFTGTAVGQMAVDTGFIPPGGPFIFSTDMGRVEPQFVSSTIEIVEGTSLPSIALINPPDPQLVSTIISFEVEGDSPEEFPVTVTLDYLRAFDDDAIEPYSDPVITGTNPLSFDWTTTTGDIGIWKAVFSATDSSGLSVSQDVVIQVIATPEYLMELESFETTNTADVVDICHGNFDSDNYLEMFVSGTGVLSTPVLELLDFDEASENWIEEYDSTIGYPQFGPVVGFFDSDDNLDAATMGYKTYSTSLYDLVAFLGHGDNTFEVYDGADAGHVARMAALGEFTGDEFLDYACTYFDGVRIYKGHETGANFVYHDMIHTPDSTLTVIAADFDTDGNDDLAIGTSQGVKIYLGDGSGEFSHVATYTQSYGSFDIKVTNQGSDFNNDNIFDLCISTPSVGGEFSHLYIYLGNGDGTFQQQQIGTFKGQIWGNCVADFNGDNQLDIAFINGSLEYLSILFGDGSGNFDNQILYDIPHPMPQKVDCFDVDLDGDPDIVVAANGGQAGYSIFTYLNQLDPIGFNNRSFQISAEKNSEIELVSSSGDILNKFRNTMPSGDYYQRNIDSDAVIDAFVSVSVIESDQYVLTAAPKANLPAGESFSLEFSLDGSLYRLASDVAMSSEGYKFDLYLGYSCDVYPRPGKFTASNPPTFGWSGSGQFDFELSSEVDFGSTLISETVAGNSYTPAGPLSVTDTSTYYWRVKPHGAPEFDCRYVVNLVIGGEEHPGDVDHTGSVDVDDVIFLINYIFVSGPPPDPYDVGDVNCSGLVDIDDAIHLIGYIFAGGFGPNDIDGDGVPDC